MPLEVLEGSKGCTSPCKGDGRNKRSGRRHAAKEAEHELEQALLTGEALAEQLEVSEAKVQTLELENQSLLSRNELLARDVEQLAESLDLAAGRLAETESDLASSEDRALRASSKEKAAVGRQTGVEKRLRECERELAISQRDNARAQKELELLQIALENTINARSSQDGLTESGIEVERIVQFLEKQLEKLSFAEAALERRRSSHDHDEDDYENDYETRVDNQTIHFGRKELYVIESEDEQEEGEANNDDDSNSSEEDEEQGQPRKYHHRTKRLAIEAKECTAEDDCILDRRKGESKCEELIKSVSTPESESERPRRRLSSCATVQMRHLEESKVNSSSKNGQDENPPCLPPKPKGLALRRMTRVSELIKQSLNDDDIDNNDEDADDDIVHRRREEDSSNLSEENSSTVWGVRVKGRRRANREKDADVAEEDTKGSGGSGRAALLKRKNDNQNESVQSSILVESNRKQPLPGSAIPSRDVPTLPAKPTYHLRPLSHLTTLSTSSFTGTSKGASSSALFPRRRAKPPVTTGKATRASLTGSY